MEFKFTLQCLLWVFCVLNSLAKGQTDDDDNYAIATLGPDQFLRGLKTVTGAGQVICKFLGIPYAIPPLGDRRFQPPEPAPQWSGQKDAVNKSTICPQFNGEDTTSVRSEDCLYLNVYSPNLNGSLPVLVWIHGGGYRVGSGYHDGDGATLAPRGIVVVTINYRLGPLGFSSTGDDVMPGNYGMLDQVLALKWVQENIAAFGGDPSMVTIAGESAGSASVSLQIVSPLARGLFIRAIMESGSSYSSFSVERPGDTNTVAGSAKTLAEELGCILTTSTEILQCLRDVDADRLMSASQNVNPSLRPRIENVYGFLPDYPMNFYKTGNISKVDTIMGANSGEMCSASIDPEGDGITKQEFVEKFSRYSSYVNGAAMNALVVETYTENVTDPMALRKCLIQANADMSFGGASIYEIVQTLKIPNTTTRHYFYEFDRRQNGTTGTPEWCGVAHAQERQYVFFDSDTPFIQSNYPGLYSPEDVTVAEDVQAMWTNFIKFGDPTPADATNVEYDDVKVTYGAGDDLPVTWEPYTEENPMMITIDVQSTELKYPRPEVIPLFDQLMKLMMTPALNESTPIIG